jgi:hypothetical protein
MRKCSVSWNLLELSQLWWCNGNFGPHTTQNHLRTKQLVSGTWNSSTVAACSFCSAQAATVLEFHVPLMNYFVCRWFCVVHGPKPPLHHHNLLSSGKFQDTEHFLIPCPRHVSSWLPPSGETCNYATAPMTQKKYERFSPSVDMLPFCMTILAAVPQRSEIPEELMNLPFHSFILLWKCFQVHITSAVSCHVSWPAHGVASKCIRILSHIFMALTGQIMYTASYILHLQPVLTFFC